MNVLISFAQINIDLATFPIWVFFFHTHSAMAHSQAVLNAPFLEPRLATDPDPYCRLETCCEAILADNCALTLRGIQDTPSHSKINLDF